MNKTGIAVRYVGQIPAALEERLTLANWIDVDSGIVSAMGQCVSISPTRGQSEFKSDRCGGTLRHLKNAILNID
jgi:hypothetical protein